MNIVELIADLFVFGQPGGSTLKGGFIALLCGIGLISSCFFIDSFESNYKEIYSNQDNLCFTKIMNDQSDMKISLYEYYEFDKCIGDNKITLKPKSPKTKDEIKNELFN